MSALEVIERQMAAFNRHDAAALAANVTPDFVWLSVEGERVAVVLRGREALEEEMRDYFASFPGVRSVLEAPVASGPFVAGRERVTWVGSDGEERSQGALAIYEVRTGAVVRVWYYPAGS